ncbi:hypothetical protein K491DRAFT_121417 [Lophiostoma macrostomum CBS 122681]|uniref:Uncharacterized protein n=1 Tax=Lophiostoma macrostomum CBS 122681 TaxID=1314788 RepID=A0A6A6TKE1_9PLEO|nr:hypothetical protein K491DRAFT_121417 [Lophiostoma macrostomum CBS 122681]
MIEMPSKSQVVPACRPINTKSPSLARPSCRPVSAFPRPRCDGHLKIYLLLLVLLGVSRTHGSSDGDLPHLPGGPSSRSHRCAGLSSPSGPLLSIARLTLSAPKSLTAIDPAFAMAH